MLNKILDKLSFDSSTRRNINPISESSSNRLSYNPALVARLEKENRQLLSAYWKTLTAAQNHNLDLTKQLLVKFKDLLVDHLLRENTSLYVYLRHSSRLPSARNAVNSVKSEMDDISRNVLRFLEKAIQEDINFNGDFIARFEEIGLALTERIEKEEAFVYPNYRPRT